MKRFGTFKPQRTDDLRDDVRHFIGKRMLFTFAGYSREDEPYPGESRLPRARALDRSGKLIIEMQAILDS